MNGVQLTRSRRYLCIKRCESNTEILEPKTDVISVKQRGVGRFTGNILTCHRKAQVQRKANDGLSQFSYFREP